MNRERDKGKQVAQETGKGHPHEGDKNDKGETSRNPAKATHMKGHSGRQKEQRQDAQEPGKGHPHEGKQKETRCSGTLQRPPT